MKPPQKIMLSMKPWILIWHQTMLNLCRLWLQFIAKYHRYIHKSSQCAPSFLTPTKKSMKFFNFYHVVIHIKVSNQLKKPAVIGLPKFTIVNLAWKCHKHASFSIENLFFEDYSVGSPMSDSFLDWFWTTLCKTTL